ncbi:PR domain zinc finger protein 1-like [Hypanus sabinus]|uniref:PR domain zinc finger protein 1-like n=1 Tax=Hypanus sabinus TaxID=79690 RepID=UPI0028C3CF8A|nr:PR domain zinc finger protein 1-like [Hypanus sabinus]
MNGHPSHAQGLVSNLMYSPGCHLLCRHTYPSSTLSPHYTRHALPKYSPGSNGLHPLSSPATLNNTNNLRLFGKMPPVCGGFIVESCLSDTTMSRMLLPPEERHVSEQPKGIPIPAPTRAYLPMAPGVGLKEMPLTQPSTSGASISSTNVCSKPFGHPSNLKACDKRFTHAGNLKTLHTGERPYHCKQCSAKFTQLTHLKLHGRVHKTERPHKCHLCSRSYNHLRSLKRHQKGHCCMVPDTKRSKEDDSKVNDEIDMSERQKDWTRLPQ